MLSKCISCPISVLPIVFPISKSSEIIVHYIAIVALLSCTMPPIATRDKVYLCYWCCDGDTIGNLWDSGEVWDVDAQNCQIGAFASCVTMTNTDGCAIVSLSVLGYVAIQKTYVPCLSFVACSCQYMVGG